MERVAECCLFRGPLRFARRIKWFDEIVPTVLKATEVVRLILLLCKKMLHPLGMNHNPKIFFILPRQF